MEKQKSIMRSLRNLTILAAISAAIVIMCVYLTIHGSMVALIVGVVFTCVGCMAIEKADRIQGTKEQER